MLDTWLEVLLAVSDGDHDLESIAATTGLSPEETFEAIGTLQRGGFLTHPGSADDDVHVSAAGRRLLRLGADELYKRALAQRLGGDPGSAS